ncbi:hypothetical protein T05_14437 [Trichinella murrelli]|uniref:Uncharacterized protein n=1 Tax=Trichinella murrelli TaxID=144512 RepID=A0A0V0TE06_9BILA|nr:hypothetical protein T05_14437 [Trichinella murrelli]
MVETGQSCVAELVERYAFNVKIRVRLPGQANFSKRATVVFINVHALYTSREGSVGSRCSSTICQTFDRQANESGLYDVDSSWPTEYWVVKKKVAGTRSVDSNEQRVNVQQDETTVREIDGYSKRQAQPPMSGSLKAAMVIWRARPSGGFFKYFIDAQLTQWRKQPLLTRNEHPPTSAYGVSVTPVWAARCRDNDLADGVRVLSSSYPRLSATSPWPGHTD